MREKGSLEALPGPHQPSQPLQQAIMNNELINIRTLEELIEAFKRDPAFTLIKSLSDPNLPARLKDQLVNQSAKGRSINVIVRTLVGELEAELETYQGLVDKKLLRASKQALWQKLQPQITTIFHSELMNANAKEQLQAWANRGIEEVERREMRDLKTCTNCRQLHGTVWKIADLLKLDYPLTQDPTDSSKWISHPGCRGGFLSRERIGDLDLSGSIDDILERVKQMQSGQVPTVKIQEVRPQPVPPTLTVNLGGFQVEDIPRAQLTDVERTAQELGVFRGNLKVVDEITADPIYQDWLRGQVMAQEGLEGPALDARVNDLLHDQTGKLVSVQIGDQTLIDAKAQGVSRIPMSVSVAEKSAHQTWQDQVMGRELEAQFKELVEKLRAEAVSEPGLELVVGEPPVMTADNQSVFVAAYVDYVTNPFALKYRDPAVYEWLRESVFSGLEYTRRQL
ncbi:MAG: hypothetical protein A2V67_06325 [Deltaproteobacteria bacterium RBG_13_61_14]|nr:MAG: hypothetical protein A2V67_06325 [Deltaproteobacteria bacterium RBG_13_61_14]